MLSPDAPRPPSSGPPPWTDQQRQALLRLCVVLRSVAARRRRAVAALPLASGAALAPQTRPVTGAATAPTVAGSDHGGLPDGCIAGGDAGGAPVPTVDAATG